ncbi:HNH/ENDO VII family nuclease [Vibrio sp. nBUS_14]|uniref:HNH/ENDO VII family nuclease n=1 Tax=Vibrio sp. nBUS_14 TaxID=3395321 RepID=UPI003EBAA97E
MCGSPNKKGNAPIGNDGHPVELHHRNQKPDGPLDEMTRTDHRLGDNFKKNHPNTGQEPSQIDRKAWRKEQKDYWKREWDSWRFDDM